MSLRFLSQGLARCAMASPQWARPSPFPTTTTTTTIVLRSFATQKHKNLLKHAKGFKGRSKNCFRIAIRRVQKSWQYAYRDRKRKKREWHKLWIQRIQAGVRQYSWRYSDFFGHYRNSPMQMDRKVLAELAANEPFAFKSVVQVVDHQKVTAGK